MSVSPWARIEANTHSAAMLKRRSFAAIESASTSSEKVIVATPLGPNQAMKARVGASGKWKRPVTTSIEPAGTWYSAEKYHQDYLQKNPGGYTSHYNRPIKFGTE